MNYCVLAQNHRSCRGTKWPPTTPPEPPTSPKHCKFIVFLDMRTQHMGMILATLPCDRRQTLVIHVVLRRWPESGCATAPCWAPQMGQHFNANTWKFMLFCVRATKHKACKLQLRSCATSRKPFEILRVGIKLPPSLGDQMITNMRPRTANIAKTLQIHCVSGHARAPHADVPRNVSLPPSPNTANSCGFASLAGI